MSSNNGSAPNGTSATVSHRPIKVTVVGDGTVGKTCLLIAYTEKRFPEEYIPTVFENYAGSITVDGANFNMTLWDTAGQEEYERLRPLSYPSTDVFLLCFAIDNPNSHANVINKWRPELRHYCPRTPIVLVGTKMDVRQDPNVDPKKLVSLKEGKKLRGKIRAARYIECSALTQENLQRVFEEAVRTVMAGPGPSRKKYQDCKFL